MRRRIHVLLPLLATMAPLVYVYAAMRLEFSLGLVERRWRLWYTYTLLRGVRHTPLTYVYVYTGWYRYIPLHNDDCAHLNK
jgi:hypothetical protein